jgi:hypothetical protein
VSEFDSIYPLEVYRRVSDEGVRLADGSVIGGEIVGGTTLPPFRRALAEAIAGTRPHWARFEDTDIGPEVRTDDYDHIYISWARNFGDRVTVVQEVVYEWSGQMIGPTAFPSAKLWTHTEFELEVASGSDARVLSESLQAAGSLLDQLDEATTP